jgi:outer membrane receptor protein involved in Fe transport
MRTSNHQDSGGSKRVGRLYLLASVAPTAFFMTSVSALAQDATASAGAAPAQLEEIVVSARKTSETLNRVPVAVSAVTAQTLTRYNLTDLQGIATRIPAVTFEKTAGNAGGALTIRGLGSGGVDAGQEQTVAVNIDGVQVSRGQIIQQSVFDLAQVDVLKGPQALFFGKNSPGGVISLRSQGPTDHLTGYLKGGYEFNAAEKTVEGAISGPITDTLGARLAVRGSWMRGWMKNDATSMPNPFAGTPGLSNVLPGAAERYNGSSEVLGRATVVFKPTSELSLTLRGFGSHVKDNGTQAGVEITRCAMGSSSSFTPAPGFSLPDPSGDCVANGHQSLGALPTLEASTESDFRDGKPYGEYTSALGSLNTEYKGSWFTATSVTGYMWYNQKTLTNANNTVYPYGGTVFQSDIFRQFSQEVRLASNFEFPVNFTVGAYYESTSASAPNKAIIAPLPVDPLTGRLVSFERVFRSTGKTYSAFGQLRWNVNDQIELAGGARWTSEKKTGTIGNVYVHPILVPTGIFRQVGLINDKFSDSNISPEATLSWHPIRNSTVYVAYKTGYKSGGYGAPSVVSPNFVTAADDRYQSEKIKGGEAGFKLEILNNTLRLTGAIYSYKLSNLQVSNFLSNPPSQQTTNAGASRTKGAELELTWRAATALTLSGGAAYTHARYISFDDTLSCYGGQTAATGCKPNGLQNLSGAPLVRAPDWSLNGAFSYEHSLSDALKIQVDGSVRYTSSYFTAENDSPFSLQHGYASTDLAIRLSSQDDSRQLALIGKNLTNYRYKVFSLDNPISLGGDIESVVARGRVITVEATLRF